MNERCLAVERGSRETEQGTGNVRKAWIQLVGGLSRKKRGKEKQKKKKWMARTDGRTDGEKRKRRETDGMGLRTKAKREGTRDAKE